MKNQPALQVASSQGENRGRGVAHGLLVQRRPASPAASASVNADGTVSLVDGLDRHRRHARLASPCSWPRRSASRAEDVKPQVVDTDSRRLHRRHRRQPHHLRRPAGPRTSCGQDIQRADDRRAPPRSGSVEPDEVVYDDDGIARGPNDADGKTQLTFKELAAQAARAPAAPIVGRRQRRPARRRRRPSPTHIVDVEVDPETGKVDDPALHGRPGRRHGDPPQLRRGPDPGRRRPGHRLGAERGVLLRRRGPHARTPASSTTACRPRSTCR